MGHFSTVTVGQFNSVANSPPSTQKNGCFDVVSTRGGLIYLLCKQDIYYTQDEGVSWSKLAVQEGLHIQTLATPPLNNEEIYLGTSNYGGVYHSPDRGAHWEEAGQHLSNAKFNVTGISSIKDGTKTYLYAATTEQGVWINPGNGWVATTPFYAKADKIITPDSGYPQHIVVSTQYEPADRPDYSARIYYSYNYGRTWIAAPFYNVPPHTDARRLNYQLSKLSCLIVNPINPHELFACDGIWAITKENIFYKSIDGGISWNTLSTGIAPSDDINTDNYYTMLVNPTKGNEIYGARGTFEKSIDGGITWKRLKARRFLDTAIFSMGMDPTDTKKMYLGTHMEPLFYKTSDGGLTWSPRNVGLPDDGRGMEINTLLLDPINPNTIYIAVACVTRKFRAGGGVYVSYDSGDHWKHLDQGLEDKVVNTLHLREGKLFAGTTDGIYAMEIGTS